MKIEVYENSISNKVIKNFSSKKELYKWNEKHDVFADQIAINGVLMYSWEEIDRIKRN